MHDMIFVNLPVADVEESRRFYSAVGYTFVEELCQEGTCLAVQLGPNIFAMLLSREFFGTFHQATTAGAGTHESLLCVSAADRAEVDDVVERALAAGGQQVRVQDEGFMYGRSYTDPDGHIWEVMYMDVGAARAADVFPGEAPQDVDTPVGAAS